MIKDQSRFPIVGIGASAGGIAAMEGLFRGVSEPSSLAFVIITHLSPERESMLHRVIGQYTNLPVKIADDGMRVEAGTVYVMPQNALLTIKSGALSLRRPDPLQRERKPVDIFFASLAEDQGDCAIGIVLSGGDSDGTLGVKAIKEHGGLTVAQIQDGSGPRNPDMPQSAISTGLVDLALPAEDMGVRLAAYAKALNGDFGGMEDEIKHDQVRISALLQRQTGHDFNGYKSKTFMRRVKRRMQVTEAATIDRYVEIMSKDKQEITNLFRDLLINVTNFFRDAEAFDVLKTVAIHDVLSARDKAGDVVRAWVPGCATGEEVYTIAILLLEEMEAQKIRPRIQLFATDIDEHALTVARAGRYPETLLKGVSDERKRRFFVSDGPSFTVSKEVREMCVFSPHSIIRDPPFSRMDLISCRNLLIYLGPGVQTRVIPTFHYALRPGGYLFLGSSEGVSQHVELFNTIDKKHRLFKAREHVDTKRLPVLEQAPLTGKKPFEPSSNDRRVTSPIRQVVEAQVLERFSPPHVVVNGDGDVVYYSARTGLYLETPQGVPSRQLVSMARRGLRVDLRSALKESMESRRAVIRPNVAVELDGEDVPLVRLTVEPLPDNKTGEMLYLVLFETTGTVSSQPKSGAGEPGLAIELERELREIRERLQSTIEEYETALEELKSSNEELISINEEAQSSNEELEASKEEMQSLNEELNTINGELADKVDKLDHANADLKNLFESTRIATVFLDRDLVIRSFTPAASNFFKLRRNDVGRPLTELATPLEYPELRGHIAAVFESGEMIEHQLERSVDGAHFLVRLIPYRDSENDIGGVVVTFVDVSSMVEALQHQRVLISELNHRVRNMLAVIISVAAQTQKNSGSKEAFGENLTARLRAMARSYSLLSRENWREVQLAELLRQHIEPFDNGKVTIKGPDVLLKPEDGLAFGMALYELASNAARYGALASDAGTLDVSWSIVDGAVKMSWVETGETKDLPAAEPGLGMKLIEGEINYRLGGSIAMKVLPDGMKAEIMLPKRT